ncbi:MAG: hypothetical protein ACO2O2_02125 [Acidilobaceae archaeon]
MTVRGNRSLFMAYAGAGSRMLPSTPTPGPLRYVYNAADIENKAIARAPSRKKWGYGFRSSISR